MSSSDEGKQTRSGAARVREYRRRQQEKGLKEVRVWVPEEHAAQLLDVIGWWTGSHRGGLREITERVSRIRDLVAALSASNPIEELDDPGLRRMLEASHEHLWQIVRRARELDMDREPQEHEVREVAEDGWGREGG